MRPAKAGIPIRRTKIAASNITQSYRSSNASKPTSSKPGKANNQITNQVGSNKRGISSKSKLERGIKELVLELEIVIKLSIIKNRNDDEQLKEESCQSNDTGLK